MEGRKGRKKGRKGRKERKERKEGRRHHSNLLFEGGIDMKRLSELTGRCLVYRTGKEWEFKYVCRGKNQKRSFVLSEIALLFYT